MTSDDTTSTEQRDADEAESTTEATEETNTDESRKGETLDKVSRERREARERARKAETELEGLKTKQREAEESKAKEDGKFKELLETREKELETLKSQLADRDLKERKATIAKQHGIPDEFVDRLQGDSDEDIETDAKAVAKLLKAREAPDNDGGEKTPSTVKKTNKSEFSEPARWGLRR